MFIYIALHALIYTKKTWHYGQSYASINLTAPVKSRPKIV